MNPIVTILLFLLLFGVAAPLFCILIIKLSGIYFRWLDRILGEEVE